MRVDTVEIKQFQKKKIVLVLVNPRLSIRLLSIIRDETTGIFKTSVRRGGAEVRIACRPTPVLATGITDSRQKKNYLLSLAPNLHGLKTLYSFDYRSTD